MARPRLSRRSRSRFFRPSLEQLEERTLLSGDGAGQLLDALLPGTFSALDLGFPGGGGSLGGSLGDGGGLGGGGPGGGPTSNADLVVTSLSAPAAANLGDEIDVLWTVMNQGTDPIPLSWFDGITLGSGDQFFSTAVEVNDQNGGSLAPGDSRQMSQMITIPSYLPGGTGTLTIAADTFNNQQESNENNNTRTVSIDLTAPDLKVSLISVSATEVTGGQSVDVTWEVTNQGTAPALAGWTDVLSLGNVYSESFAAPRTLQPGESYQVSATFTVPLTVGGTSIDLTVGTDDFGAQGETAEDNNTATTVLGLTTPDLQISDLSVSVNKIGPGDSIEVTWVVTNIGAAAALASWVDKLQLGSNDYAVEVPAPGPLQPGESYQGSHTFTVPDSVDGTSIELSVRADATEKQGETREDNNAATTSLAVKTPDLVVSDLSVTGEAAPGAPLEVSWTVSNVGEAPLPLDWIDLITLENGDASWYFDDELEVYENGAFLAPGASLQQMKTVTLPADVPGGPITLSVMTDAYDYWLETDEDNNTRSISITGQAPDLVVTDLSVSVSELVPGQSFAVDWRIVNQGTATAYQSWSDLLSVPNAFDGFQYFDIPGPLAPGASYTGGGTVTLPSTYVGDSLTVTVQTDYRSHQVETDESNNEASLVIPVRSADLALSAQVPASIVTGVAASVSWTVANQGDIATANGWSDFVYLSADDVRDFGDILLTRFDFDNAPALAADDHYTVTRDLTVPEYYGAGSYYLLFLTDPLGQVGEKTKANNFLAMPVTVQAPDLVVSSADAPASVIANETDQVSWTVTNNGAVPAAADWVDRVYLSADDTLDGGDTLVINQPISSQTPLAAGDSYTANASFIVPAAAATAHYLLFVVNAASQQGETDTTNNVLAVPVQGEAPDLVVSSADIPAEADSGTDIAITWHDQNIGAVAATGNWSDRIYLVQQPTDLFGLDMGTVTFSGTLDPGQSVERSATISLPREMSGTWYVRISANGDGHFGEGNLNNNTWTQAIAIHQSPYPNLTASGVTAPASVLTDDEPTVSWTVTNTGELATSQTWKDQVWLSKNTFLGIFDTYFLGEVDRVRDLAPGESYTGQLTVHTPRVEAGSYFILVKTDSGDAVYERGRESDNVDSAAIDVQFRPPPDLQVTAATAPASALLGERTALSWTVTNTSAQLALDDWNDRVYLSADETLDDNDLTLLTQPIQGQTPLAAGRSYQIQTEVTLPTGAENLGRRYLLFATNFDHGQGESDLSNNVRSLAIDLHAPDLQVTQSSAPAVVVLGQNVTVSWTVTNVSAYEAGFGWFDSVYLSTDQTLDAGDTPLTSEYFVPPTPLAGGGSYQVQKQFTMPRDGQYVGARYLLFVTDTLGYQPETDDGNNVAARAVTVTAPDLVVSNITVPAQEVSGNSILVSWRITNQGNAAATGWTDHVYLSTDTQGTDVIDLGTFDFSGTLAAGASVVRQFSVQIPRDKSGTFYAHVHANDHDVIGEQRLDNNDAYSSQTLRVILSPFPNLVVSQVTPPPSVFSGQETDVSWIVTNTGNGPTDRPVWYDAVFLSTDQTLDNFDTFLGWAPNASYLNADESYANHVTFRMPRGIDGTYYYLVKTDYFNSIDEYIHEDDNVGHGPSSAVHLSPFPDLVVSAVQLPVQAFSGTSVKMSWTVENRGTGATQETYWVDSLYFIDDTGRTRYLGDVAHSGALGASGSYTASANISLPVEVSGTLHFFVVTDVYNHVYEFTFDNNNLGETTSLIYLQPPPDLVVTSIEAPSQARSSQSIAVRYQVANLGSIVTPNQDWTDAIFVQTSPTYNPSEAQLLATVRHVGALAVNASYQVETDVYLPDGLQGNYYLFVRTDTYQQVFEVDRDNNLGHSQQRVQIQSQPADLLVAALSGPVTVESGKKIQLNWTVTNAGSGDTITNVWSDNVFVSTSNTFSNALFLGYVPHTGLLNVGESYSATGTFTVPLALTGTLYFFVVTDAGARVYEGAREDNNISAPWRIEATRQLADLQVTALSGPAEAQAGGTLEVQYTVQNKGNGTANASFWNDNVYLSPNDSLGPAIQLGTYRRTNPLKPGESYQVTRSFSVPADLNGLYKIIVVTDSNGAVEEAENENNNARASADFVNILGGVASVPPPVYDLSLTQVDAPDFAVSGRMVSVSWTVRNNADSLNISWYDAVYLSLDQYLDAKGDSYLGYAAGPTTLVTGDSYTRTQSFRVPDGLSGLFYVLVQTDAWNWLGEGATRADNLGFDADPVQVSLQPPADLVAGAITIPATAQPGDDISVQYSVSNQGTSAAEGSWLDSLYLSADDHWDVGDVLLGRVEHQGGVLADASYSETLKTRLPGVVPGNYSVIVRSDILNNIRESDETNNLSASLDQMMVDVPSLTLGQAATGTFNAGNYIYYQVTLTAGQALHITLDADDAANTELYVRYGAMPTRGNFDFAYRDPLAADQQILVPTTQAGVYYVVAYLESGPPATAYALKAQTIDFSILDTTYGKGGTAGSRTIEINGAKFDATVTAKLTNDAGFTLVAQQMYYISSSKVYATFDLTQVTPGIYNVVIENAAGQSARLTNGFEVVKGGAGHLTIAQQTPERIRQPRPEDSPTYPFLVAWTNDGYNDIAAPFILVDSGALLSFTPDFTDANGTLAIYGRGVGDGPAGILMPGQAGVKRAFFRPDASIFSIQIHSTYLGHGVLTEAFPWEMWPDVANATTRTGDAFTELINQLKIQVGTTWGDYLAMLSRNANRIPAELGDPANPAALVALEVRDAEAALTTSVRGRLTVDQGDLKLGGLVINLVNRTTQETKSVYVLNDGTFTFANLQPAEYELKLPGTRIANPEAARFTLAAQQHITGLELHISTGAIVQITVLDADQHPVADAPVYVVVDGAVIASGFTDAKGTISYSGLGGAVTIVAQTSVDQSQAVMEVALHDGSQAVTLQVQAGLRVVGAVLAADEQPLGLATIWLENLDDGFLPYAVAASGQDGLFVVQGLSQGHYQATISKPGYADATLDFTIGLGQDQTDLGAIHLQSASADSISAQVLPILPALGWLARGFSAYLIYGAYSYPQVLMQPDGIDPNIYVKVDELLKVWPDWMVPLLDVYLNQVGIPFINLKKNADFAFVAAMYLQGSGGYLGVFGDDSITGNYFRTHPLTTTRFLDAYQNAVAGLQDLLNQQAITCDQIDGGGVFAIDYLIDVHAKATGKDLKYLYYTDGNIVANNPALDAYWNFDLNDPNGGTMVGGVGGGELHLPDSNPDSRRISGYIVARKAGNQLILQPRGWTMTIGEVFDFLPGNLAPLTSPVRLATVPMAFLEGLGVAKDVSYTIQFSKLDYGDLLPKFVNIPDGTLNCHDDPDPNRDDGGGSGNSGRGTDGGGGVKTTVYKIVSADPNDILGPAGFGDERWVSVNDSLAYTIRFENDPDIATAPAQVVQIVQQLDSDLDFRTFRIGDFGFGDLHFDVPGDRAFYQGRIDLTATKGFYVDVVAGIDVATGRAFWDLRTIDPKTGDLPSDPSIGFLPVDLANGIGQGFVSYTVRPKATVATGTRIDAQATIIFDINPPIDTPKIFNTVDAGTPQTTDAGSHSEDGGGLTGSIMALADGPPPSSTLFRISWEARDDDEGSAIASYTVYLSINGGPLQVFLQDTPDTEALYDGVPGFHYEFYIVARDYAGNVEPLGDTPDVVVDLPGGDDTPPISAVQALPEVSQPHFLVSWSGQDNAGGSGLDNFDIYVSINGAPSQVWLRRTTSTSAYYDGLAGNSYAFISTARDHAGKVEAAPAAADASTFVSGPLKGVIAGQFYGDTDGNGSRDEGESALAGWTVFLDTNENGIKDDGEISTVTDDRGNFFFANLTPGTYLVTPVIQSGWELTGSGILMSTVTATSTAGSTAPAYLAVEGNTVLEASALPSMAATAVVGLDSLHADPRFSGIDGTGFNVAILDTGVDAALPFFGPDANGDGVGDAIVAQIDFTQGQGDESTAHGSSVARVIAARDGTYPGVASGAGLVVLKVMNGAGQGSFASVERALQWLVAHAAEYHIAAVNFSFGDRGHYTTDVGLYGISDELAALSRQNVILVAAAGNDYGMGDGLAYPAADANVLAVGAVYPADLGGPLVWKPGVQDNTSGTDRLAAFSQRATESIFAPGVQIAGVGADGTWKALSGTSLAAPFVSGAAALAQQLAEKSLGRLLTPDEFRRLLVRSGVVINDGDDENDSVFNTGRDFARLDVHALAEAILQLSRQDGTAATTAAAAPAAAANQVFSAEALNGALTVNVGPGETVGALRFGFRTQQQSTSLSAPIAVAPKDSISDETPTFSWNPVAHADHYDVWVNIVVGGHEVASSMVLRNANVAGTSWTPTDAQALTPGQTYKWYVAAVAGDGTHFWNAGQIFTLAGLPAPVTHGPSDTTSDDTPTFTWDSVAAAKHYDVWVNDLTTGQVMVLRNDAASGISWTPSAAQALTPGHTYMWWVASVSTNDTRFWSSGQLFAVAALQAPTPIDPKDTVADTPTFTWNTVPDAVHYDVWVNSVIEGHETIGNPVLRNASAAGGSWAAGMALTPGQTYRWYVGAVSTNGTVFWSAGQTFAIAPLAAPAPSGPSGTIATDVPTFTWASVAPAQHYDVWVDNLSTGQRMVRRNNNVTDTSWALGSAQALIPGHTYRWWVASVSTNGTHFWNGGQTFTVNLALSPAGGAVTAESTTFTWNAASNAEHYDVWVNTIVNGLESTGNPVLRNANATGTSWTPATALTPGQSYRWYLGTVISGVTYWSPGRTFSVAPLAAPVPSGQVDTSEDAPTFRWNAVPGAAHYDVWLNTFVAGKETIGHPVLRNDNVADTFWKATAPLTPGQTYRWYVGSVSSNGTTFWSAGQTFTVGLLQPPIAVAPRGTIDEDMPSFTWSAVARADHYEVWVNAIVNGAESINTPVLRNISATGTSWTPAAALERGRSYRWYVGAVSPSGTIFWNEGTTFFVSV